MQKTTNPFKALFESLFVILDADFEDSDVTPEELALAERRFAHALRYIIVSTVDEKAPECDASKTVSD